MSSLSLVGSPLAPLATAVVCAPPPRLELLAPRPESSRTASFPDRAHNHRHRTHRRLRRYDENRSSPCLELHIHLHIDASRRSNSPCLSIPPKPLPPPLSPGRSGCASVSIRPRGQSVCAHRHGGHICNRQRRSARCLFRGRADGI
jgi:hypothetical protein